MSTTTISTGGSISTVVSSGDTLTVLSGGTASGVIILSGGTADFFGIDSGTTIGSGGVLTLGTSATEYNVTVASGGTETLGGGTVTGGDVYGLQQVLTGTSGAFVTGETIYSGGTLDFENQGNTFASSVIESGGVFKINGNATGLDLTLAGGTIELTSKKANLTGTLSFSGVGTLVETVVISAGSGDLATIYGFGAGDVIDLSTIGTGAMLASSTVGVDTVVTIAGGSKEGTVAESFTFAGTGGTFALGTDSAGTGEALTQTGTLTIASTSTTTSSSIPTLASFTAGDIVISVVGDVNGSGTYTDNQAAPVMLEEIDPTTGTIVGELLLSQTASGSDYAFSGEYGSSSEGILELSADGKSLVIAGYGVNAATYNEGGAAVYGNAALAQSTSVEGGEYTAVARTIADISYSGTVDTSTALYDVDNENNPRSVATEDGSVFYLSGQGAEKGDSTEGVYVANDGSTVATAIDTTNDTREVEIYNGELYISEDSSAGEDNIATFGDLPTSSSTPTILSGIDQSVTLTTAEANSLNAIAVGSVVDLSPEQYFFANATTLYVADGGQPKAGTIGDGGLQKWILDPATGKWSLAYTLSAGLNLVENSNVSSDTAGTTGLIGLTAVLNADGTVTFYATNSTIGDLDQTYLYTITDVVSATTAPAGATFTVVETAAADTNIRGIALAPSAPASTEVTSGQTVSGLTVSGGSTAQVDAGGTLSGAVVLSGGTAAILGVDTGSLLVEGGSETVSGIATGDNVYGTQIISGSASDETVYYAGTLAIAAGGTATDITVEIDGGLADAGMAGNITLAGGEVIVTSGGTLGAVSFTGGGEVVLAGTGVDEAGVITGFTSQDVIDLEQIGFSSAVLTSTIVGGNTVETVTSGTVSQSVTLAGTYASGQFTLAEDSSNGTEIVVAGSTVAGTLTVSSGTTAENVTIAAGGSITVASGGALVSGTILSGGNAVVAGSDSYTTIASGGSETVSGTATGDAIYGTQLVSAATALVTNETIFNGGTLDLFLKGAVANGIVISSGGALNISGNAVAENLTIAGGTVDLQSPKSSLTGSIVFAGAGTIEEAAVISAGYAPNIVIAGFAVGDTIALDGFSGGTLTSSTVSGNTVETIISGTLSEGFTFAGTYAADYFTLNTNGALVVSVSESAANTITISSGQSASADYVVSSGYTLDVLSGGSASGATILSGGTANFAGTDSATTISTGGTAQLLASGTETNVTIEAGGTETLNGGTVAGGDVYGLQQVLTGTTGVFVTGETIHNGGTLAFGDKSNTFTSGVVESGGVFSINGNASGVNLIIAGGTIDLQSPKANLDGTLSLTGAGGELLESSVVSGSAYGDVATIYGFTAGDVIDLSAIGTGATFTSTSSAGNTTITVAGGSTEELKGTSFAENFTFSGTGQNFALVADPEGTGEELLLVTSMVSTGTVAGETIASGGNLLVQAGGTVTSLLVSGGSAIISGTESGGTITTGGTEFVTSGGVVSGTVIEQNSTQVLTSGAVAYGVTVGDPSTQTIAVGATAYDTTITADGETDVYGTASASTISDGGVEIVFSGGVADGSVIENGGTLVIENGATVTATQLEAGGTIDLAGLSFSTGGTVSWDSATDILSVTEGTVTDTLSFSGDYSADTFSLVADANGGTDVQVICYLRGTHLLTAHGEVPVELLRQGDKLATRFGGIQKIKWIGRQSFLRRFVEKNPECMPVRFAAGSLGDGLPRRALWVSGGHSMLVGGQLVLARHLVNGVSITRNDAPEEIHYYQVEFETHDCVLAEGVWSESYADAGGMRNMFHNAEEFLAQFPDHVAPPEPVLCAPRHLEGAKLEAVLGRIVALADDEVSPGPLHGYVETAGPGGVTGWAWDEANPELPVRLEILLDGQLTGTALAFADRQDVAEAGYGTGQSGFTWAASALLPPDAGHRLQIRRATDGAVLLGSAALMETAQPAPVLRLAG